MAIPLAHIMGIPVEETIGSFLPVAAVSFTALKATIRARRQGTRMRAPRRRGRDPWR